jgi:DNA invertase Pin-like site-specific DNA recombinase
MQSKQPDLVPAVLYARISDDRHDEAGVERQTTEGTALASRVGLKVVHRYCDNDISATSRKKRPDYIAMVAAIKAGTVKVIVAYSLDRIVRTKREEVDFFELCHKNGAVIHLVHGSFDLSTPHGIAMAEMSGTMERLNQAMKREKQLSETVQRALDGRPPGGCPRAFGYDKDFTAIRPDEAEAVRQGYTKLLATGSVSAVARKWNEDGFLTTRGNAFEPATVRRLLQNCVYAGIRAHLGKEVSKATWPAIIDESTLRAAQAVLADPDRKTTPGPARVHLLAGLAFCMVCDANGHGVRMKTFHAGTKSKSLRQYTCMVFRHVSRMGDAVDAVVQDRILARIAEPDALELLVDRKQVDVNALRVKADGLRQRRASVLRLATRGGYTDAQIDEAMDELDAEQAAIDEATHHMERAPVLRGLVGAAEDAGADQTKRLAAVHKMWCEYDLEHKRAVIDVLATVKIDKGTNGGFNPTTVHVDFRAI